MRYKLIIDLISLVEDYDKECSGNVDDLPSFIHWLNKSHQGTVYEELAEPEWKGKSNGRSADSVINTALIHLYRYAKLQAKQAISDTAFSTPDDFIYLITLVSNGSMSKTALIKLNVHEKSVGIQIINRLINNGLVEQSAESFDKRSRMIHITPKGNQLLNESMQNIRNASSNVTEPLTYPEKMDLIRLLAKLEDFHEQKSK